MNKHFSKKQFTVSDKVLYFSLQFWSVQQSKSYSNSLSKFITKKQCISSYCQNYAMHDLHQFMIKILNKMIHILLLLVNAYSSQTLLLWKRSNRLHTVSSFFVHWTLDQ